MMNVPDFVSDYCRHFNSGGDMMKWIILNTARIIRMDEHKSYKEAWDVSVAQLEMDVRTTLYDGIRFSLEDLKTKTDKELSIQQSKFVRKHISSKYQLNGK